MAYATAGGYGNLSQGNFSPIIYSKNAQLKFRKVNVAQAVTNTEYAGEIANMGDTVNIIVEPTIVVSSYARGQGIDVQDLDDTQKQLVVDQGNYYGFAIDDVERKHAHHNWEGMASDEAGYRLRDAFDSNLFTFMNSNVAAARTTGSTSTPLKVNHGGTYTLGTEVTPTLALARQARILDEGNVPMENRWAVVDPFFVELLRNDSSTLINDDYTSKGALHNGLVTAKPIHGFKLYVSNNLPSTGDGPSATSGTNYGSCFAGHISAIATAEHIKTAEKIRAERTFADVIRGLHIFGRSLLRTEALTSFIYNNGT
jgi:hypothetical protein|tara:strand:+ start:13701 stop:14639 length:939 start_codon:yes stop_codon:yes gene_type:complete